MGNGRRGCSLGGGLGRPLQEDFEWDCRAEGKEQRSLMGFDTADGLRDHTALDRSPLYSVLCR